MFPDGTARQLHDPWREKLVAAKLQYENDRSEESKRECLRVLKLFADLVVRAEIPKES
jgi:hypothetical protein